MTDIQLPPLPWEGDLTAWLEGRNDAEVEEQIQAYARAAIEAEKLHTDKLLLASVPERWKSCASSVGAVQSYIAELESAIEAHKAQTGKVDCQYAKDTGMTDYRCTGKCQYEALARAVMSDNTGKD